MTALRLSRPAAGSNPPAAGAPSIGFATPDNSGEDWITTLERMPDLAGFRVLSGETLQQPLVQHVSAVRGLFDQAKPPSGKHVHPPVIPGSCDDVETWSEDETRLRALPGDQLGPPTSSGPTPTAREP